MYETVDSIHWTLHSLEKQMTQAPKASLLSVVRCFPRHSTEEVNPAEHSSLTELRRLILKFREVEVAKICREEYRRGGTHTRKPLELGEVSTSIC